MSNQPNPVEVAERLAADLSRGISPSLENAERIHQALIDQAGEIERLKLACHQRVDEGVAASLHLSGLLSASQSRAERLEGIVQAIGRLARSNEGARTFDDCISALGRIDDLARAVLQPGASDK